MVKLIKQRLTGDNIVLGVSGTPTEIQGEVNAAYNWNYFGSERRAEFNTVEEEPYTFGADGFVYFYTSETRLRRGLLNRIENKLIQRQKVAQHFKGHKGGVHSLAQTELEKTLANIQERTFLRAEVTEIERTRA